MKKGIVPAWADNFKSLKAQTGMEAREKIISDYEKDPLNTDKALKYLMQVSLREGLECRNIIKEDHIFLPDWKVTLTPKIGRLTERSAELHFYISASQWGQALFECSVGMGSTPKQAMGMAVGSFLFSFMQGLIQMEQAEEPYELLKSHFAGHPHRWKVYLSNVVGVGDAPKLEDSNIYWDTLKDELLKRLGNQKLCYVKVYGAKFNGDITGECRINDIKSDELSALVAKIVESWETEAFASHKMFFFIRQEEETVLPYPYWEAEGYQKLKESVRIAAEMFRDCSNQERYEQLPKRMEDGIQDSTLAAECYSFLPEICAENAFNQITYPETMNIQVGAAPAVLVWKAQLADYWQIYRALFELFDEGVFGENTNTIYQTCIAVSSIYGAIANMREKEPESDLKDVRMVTIHYQESDRFEIR